MSNCHNTKCVKKNVHFCKDIKVKGTAQVDKLVTNCIQPPLEPRTGTLTCPAAGSRVEIVDVEISKLEQKTVSIDWVGDDNKTVDIFVYPPGAVVSDQPDDNVGYVATTYDAPNLIYSTKSGSDELEIVNTTDAAVVGSVPLNPPLSLFGPPSVSRFTRQTVDPCTGQIFATWQLGGANAGLVTIDPSTGNWRQFPTLSFFNTYPLYRIPFLPTFLINAIAISPEGRLFVATRGAVTNAITSSFVETGTTLTVTAVGAETLAVGQVLTAGSGLFLGPPAISIVAQLSGVPRGVGTYRVSQSQTAGTTCTQVTSCTGVIYELDRTSGQTVDVWDAGSLNDTLLLDDMAFDPKTGVMYGAARLDSVDYPGRIVTIDLGNGGFLSGGDGVAVATPLPETPFPDLKAYITALSFSPAGVLHGIDTSPFSNTQLFRDSGIGPSAAEPYKIQEVPVSIKGGDTIEITFSKDGSWYVGVDSIYCFIKDYLAPNDMILDGVPTGPVNGDINISGLKFSVVTTNGPVVPWSVDALATTLPVSKYSGDANGIHVLRCGSQEAWGAAPGGVVAPFNGNVTSLIITSTDPNPALSYNFNLELRYSTEGGYDFVTVTKKADFIKSLFQIDKLTGAVTPLGLLDSAADPGMCIMPIESLATINLDTNPKSVSVDFNVAGTWKLKVVQRNSRPFPFTNANKYTVSVGGRTFSAFPTIFGLEATLPTPTLTAPALLTEPAGACTVVTNDLTGKIGVVDFAACAASSATRIFQVENAGAVATLYLETTESFTDFAGRYQQQHAGFAVGLSATSFIKPYLTSNPNAEMTLSVIKPVNDPVDYRLCLDSVVIKGCGLVVEGDLSVNRSATIEGDLTVNGTINGLIPGTDTVMTKITADFSLVQSEYVVQQDLTVNEFILEVLNKEFSGGSGVEFPMDSLDLGEIPQGDSVNTNDGLILTNVRGNGVSTGPWRIIDDVAGPDSGIKVLKCGLDEDFFSGAFTLGETVPPRDGTVSQAQISIDTADFPDLDARFTLNMGWSTEATYDFIRIVVNGSIVFSGSGQGASKEDPYLTQSINLLVKPSDIVYVEYTKDAAAYAGNDTIYFYISNLSMIPSAPPTLFNIVRDGDVVLNLSHLIDPDLILSGKSKTVRWANTEEIVVGVFEEKEFKILKDDVIQFIPDQLSFNSYDIRLCLTQVPFGENYTTLVQHAPLKANTISYQNVVPKEVRQKEGWYMSDNFFGSLIHVEDRGTTLLMSFYDGVVTAANYVLQLPTQIVFYQREPNVYTSVVFSSLGGDQAIFVFNPATGEFSQVPNTLNPNAYLVNGVFPRKMIPLKGDERMWNYALKLTDPEAIFNNPTVFFDFFAQWYVGTKSSGQFQARSQDSYPELNAYNLDMTQFRRCFGSANKREYEDLLTALKTTGIERYYGVKRLIYWPERTCLENPLTNGSAADRIQVAHKAHGFVNGQVIEICNASNFGLTPASAIDGDHAVILIDADNYEIVVAVAAGPVGSPGGGKLVVTGVSSVNQSNPFVGRWLVNQNNAETLGLIFDFESSEKDWVKLCPGETVTMTGSGTRLDGFPLRLQLSGYHTGPRPDKVFVPVEQYDNWDFFTLRLPLVITSANNVLRGTIGENPFTLTIPLGQYYVTDIFEYINSKMPGLFFYFDGIDQRLVILGEKTGTSLNGPDNVNPSTLFSTSGLNLGYMFTSDPMVSETDGGIIIRGPDSDLGIFNTPQYRYHTPLSNAEVETLLSNLANVKVGAKHGPVRNTMPYDNYLACLNEVVEVATTEDHVAFNGFSYQGENNKQELFRSFDKMNELWQQIEILDGFEYSIGTNFAFVTNGLLLQSFIRTLGTGHPAEMSEWYIPYGYNPRFNVRTRGSGTLPWNNWGDQQVTPQKKITYPSGTYDLSERFIHIPAQNYLEEPFWLVSRPRPIVPISNTNTVRPDASAGTSEFNVTILQKADGGVNPEIVSIDARLAEGKKLNGKYFILYDDAGSVAYWFDIDDAGSPEPASGADRSVRISTVRSLDEGASIVEKINVAIEQDGATLDDNDNIVVPGPFTLQNGSGAADFYLDPYETHICPELIVETAPAESLETQYQCSIQIPTAAVENAFLPGVASAGIRPPPRRKTYTTNEWIGLRGEMIKASPANGLAAPLANAADCDGKIVFIETNGTNFLEAYNNAKAAGAIAVVYYPDNYDNLISYADAYRIDSNLPNEEDDIPTLIIDRAKGENLTSALPSSAPTGFSGQVSNSRNGDIVDGEYVIGVTKDSAVNRALAEAGLPQDTLPPKCGYMSHTDYGFSAQGSITRWFWAAEDQESAIGKTPTLAAARIVEFFNSEDVKANTIIVDDRNAIGGLTTLYGNLKRLYGGKREENYDSAYRIHNFDPNGLVSLSSFETLVKYTQDNLTGVETDYQEYFRSIDPQYFANYAVPLGFPENGFFNGSLASNPGPKTIVWYTNATQISAPQVAYVETKGTSLNTIEFDGDFGDDTRFIAYGCYYRPFATTGNYASFLNFYAKGRAGGEELVNPPIGFMDRLESIFPLAYITGSDNSSFPSTGGVVKMHGQEFERIHQPQLVWDMNANIFFQDIGFTVEDSNLRTVHIVDADLGARASIARGTSGFTVSVKRAGEARLSQTSQVDCTGSTGAGLAGLYFTLADDAGAVYVWYNTDGASVDPAPGGRGIMVSVLAGDADDQIAAKTAEALQADDKFSAWSQAVNPCASSGKPFVSAKHSDVNFSDVYSLRDSTLERTFVILVDPNVADHYYLDDGYGNI